MGLTYAQASSGPNLRAGHRQYSRTSSGESSKGIASSTSTKRLRATPFGSTESGVANVVSEPSLSMPTRLSCAAHNKIKEHCKARGG
mgnify:CR=1 FL=1